MENNILGTQMTKFVPIVQLKIPQVPHNFFGQKAQIDQLFGIFLEKKSSHHMSIVHATKYVMQQRCHGKRVVEVPNDLK